MYLKTDEERLASTVNDWRFHDMTEFSSSDIIELETAKKKVKLDIPIHIGFFVLEYAKLIMLRFYYDFLIEYLPFNSFALVQCDTDSFYIALSERTLFQTICPEKRKAFVEAYHQWFAIEYCDTHKREFFDAAFAGLEWNPSECCQRVAKYDSREAGKFHAEFTGDGIIALCSKCYYCIGDKPKLSSKGVSKTHNQLTHHDYLDVLFRPHISIGTNRGFRIKNDRIFTYTQTKKALNYMYYKRVVSSDHVTTFPTHL
jgi:hypothetical protein